MKKKKLKSPKPVDFKKLRKFPAFFKNLRGDTHIRINSLDEEDTLFVRHIPVSKRTVRVTVSTCTAPLMGNEYKRCRRSTFNKRWEEAFQVITRKRFISS